MFAAADWTNLTVAGAFVLGTVLATFAVLRVVRAVAVMFGHEPPPRWRRRHDDDDPAAR